MFGRPRLCNGTRVSGTQLYVSLFQVAPPTNSTASGVHAEKETEPSDPTPEAAAAAADDGDSNHSGSGGSGSAADDSETGSSVGSSSVSGSAEHESGDGDDPGQQKAAEDEVVDETSSESGHDDGENLSDADQREESAKPQGRAQVHTHQVLIRPTHRPFHARQPF